MKTVTKTTASAGTVAKTVDIDGTKTNSTIANTDAGRKADDSRLGDYRVQKVWNPATSAYISVTMTGNEAQDAVLLAAAFVTAGVRSDSVISTT